jgi:hypothetical protein
MCLNGNCFVFSKYAGKKVAVFISGPGYLEFPWALETASRLKDSGADVSIIDLAEYATPYAMRLRILGKWMPIGARRFLRNVFLTNKSLVENVLCKSCLDKKIKYVRECIPSLVEVKSELIPLNSVTGQTWGHLDAFDICHSTFSSFFKRNLEPTDLVDKRFVLGIEHAIKQASAQVDDFKKNQFCAVFLANGRQPVQAELALGFRSQGLEVILYEAGGGYVFPSLLRKRIDYFFTSPLNHFEHISKVSCPTKIENGDLELASVVEENVLSRDIIPFRLNFLTENPSTFDHSRLAEGRNFAFFSTSEWEISVLHGEKFSWEKERFFQNQIASVDSILSLLGENDRLFIRLHPSDPGNKSDAEDKWKVFDGNPKVVVYSPHSRVNSYELALKMDGNFVWASFLGYELALRGVPIAVVGDAFYAQCFGDKWIRSVSSLKHFIDNPQPISRDYLFPYSNYLATGGFEIRETQTDENRRIIMGGIRVDKARMIFKLLPQKLLGAIS